MIQSERTVHTDSNLVPQDDPLTASRALRHSTRAAGLAAVIVALALLAAGGWGDDLHYWNLGLTVLGLSGMGLIVAADSYMCGLVILQMREDRRRAADEHRQTLEYLRHAREATALVQADIAEIRDMMKRNAGSLLRRLDALEAGEQAICESMESLRGGADDEVARRRRGS